MELFPWVLYLILHGLQSLLKVVLESLSFCPLVIVLAWTGSDLGVLELCTISLPGQLYWDIKSILFTSNSFRETNFPCEQNKSKTAVKLLTVRHLFQSNETWFSSCLEPSKKCFLLSTAYSARLFVCLFVFVQAFFLQLLCAAATSVFRFKHLLLCFTFFFNVQSLKKPLWLKSHSIFFRYHLIFFSWDIFLILVFPTNFLSLRWYFSPKLRQNKAIVEWVE